MSSLANGAFHGRGGYSHQRPLHMSGIVVSAEGSGMLRDEVMTSLKLGSLEENGDCCMRVECQIS